MVDPLSFHYRTSGALHNTGEAEIEPPRTRIAVACNRCRRRKIKCSGSMEGASCEACIRASNAECVFADRPQQSQGDSFLDPAPVQLQPPNILRSASLPHNSAVQHHPIADRQVRSLSSASKLSGDVPGAGPSSPLAQSMRSPTYSTSPTISSKRQSLTSSSHPYQRSGSAGYRKNSGDQVASNLLRYSQSLIQAQALQLSGRPQQHLRSSSTSGPTSVPTRYAATSTQQQQHHQYQQHQQAQLLHHYQQQQQQQQQQMAFAPYQMQPLAAQSLNFRHPDYSQSSTPITSDFSAPPECTSGQFPHAGDVTPESVCYSPIYQSSNYSMSTPDLVSSGSISTVDSGSSMGFPLHTAHKAQPIMLQSRQASMSMDCSQLGSVPLIDPTQWTPGVDKMANQWLEFSPQSNEQFYFSPLE